MTGFDTVLVVDWSGGPRSPEKPAANAIWVGTVRNGQEQDPIYLRSRHEAEAWLCKTLRREQRAGRRTLATFDFPFGYPAGFARHLTGRKDPFAVWDWLAERIEDKADGRNNRFEVAALVNSAFPGEGPFWSKHPAWEKVNRFPDIPYTKRDRVGFEPMGERRRCDRAVRAASSAFQLSGPNSVGGQALMGLPVLARLRRALGAAVWPFEAHGDAQIVLAEIWPGLIEPAVKHALAEGGEAIRDAVQVRLLARALAALPAQELAAMMRGLPPEAREEAWILGAGHRDRLCALAAGPGKRALAA